MTDNEGIDKLFRDWREAWMAGEVSGLLQLVAEDAEFWTHGADPIVGRDPLGQAFQEFFREYSSIQEFQEAERLVAGGLAFIRGVEINKLVPQSGGEEIEVKQRAFSVAKRQESGEWVFFRGMTNQGAEAGGS